MPVSRGAVAAVRHYIAAPLAQVGRSDTPCSLDQLRHLTACARRPSLASASEYAYTQVNGGLWVFAYGSLMWRVPEGVHVVQRERCRLHGYARSFCVLSRNYRGTATAPGLVLGLIPAANSSCTGVALHLGSAQSPAALESLERIDAQEIGSTFESHSYLAHSDACHNAFT